MCLAKALILRSTHLKAAACGIKPVIGEQVLREFTGNPVNRGDGKSGS